MKNPTPSRQFQTLQSQQDGLKYNAGAVTSRGNGGQKEQIMSPRANGGKSQRVAQSIDNQQNNLVNFHR